MSRHGHHRKHLSNSNESNDKKTGFDFNTISSLLNNIKPEELSSLLSSFDLNGSKTVIPDEVIQSSEPIIKPVQTEEVNNSSSNKTLDLLNAIKPLLSNDRSETLAKMIQLYSIGNTSKK